ncbi:hypothetical protein D917_07943 [Trichinella nativa]|uniref:Uncharacterized protein n=1 Tax=Trichinella nativa TaxID=6335 RepID=A0A1Y3EQL4_9BILA|nr:hypothetical protein D917_07943 [Trichinella nativa]
MVHQDVMVPTPSMPVPLVHGRECIKTTPKSSYSCVHRHWPIALSSRSVNQWCHIQWKPSLK